MTVGLAVPAEVVGSLDLLHGVFVVGDIGIVSRELRYVDGRLQGKVVPSGQDEADIDVAAPVAPRPATRALNGEAGGIELPDTQVAFHGGVYVVHGLDITRMEVVGPETVGADGGQHLCGELIGVVLRGDGREEGAVGTLPVDKFAHGLAGEQVGYGVELVETLVHEDGDIAPPLGTLAVGTVEIGVAHVDIEGAHGLLAEAVEKLVGALEAAHKVDIVARLTVTHAMHLDGCILRVAQVEDLAIHPTQRLVLLAAGAGDILGTDAVVATAAHMVGLDGDEGAANGVGDIDYGSKLRIVGELRLGDTRSGNGLELADAMIFPLRYGALYEGVPGCAAPTADLERGGPVGLLFEAGIVADVRLG